MIKLSLNSPEVSKQQAPAPFASTLAAAVEAAGAQPVQTTISQATVKKQAKPVPVQLPSNGLLSRSARWLQNKGRSKKRMQMIETVSLGEKRFVALVKVDGREFLLGGAPSSVGMLADLGAHGLGELLSLPAMAETAAAESPAVAAVPEQAAAAPIAPAAQTAPARLPEPVVAEPLTLPLPVALPEPVVQVTSAEPARVNVVVEADEDESDWLLQDDLDEVFKANVAPDQVARVAEPSKVVAFRPEPIVQTIVARVEQPAAAAVPAPKTAAPLTNATFVNANFTFQMWPATSAAVTTLAPKIVSPAVAMPKVKTAIDLESCPELLGEPYVLALVQKSRGAAA